MPFATPHRALSAEFALTPTAIQGRYIAKRIEERRTRHPTIMENALAHSRLPSREQPAATFEDQEPPLPFTHDIPEPGGPCIRTLPESHPKGMSDLKTAIHPRSIIACTDG